MMTVTEGLAEIKTIEKRIQKKKEFILMYLVRPEFARDPLEKDGGTVSALQRERQSINDLFTRHVAIRKAVNEANMANTLTVQGITKTVSEWLIWKREVSDKEKELLDLLFRKVMEGRGAQYKVADGGYSPAVVSLNEKDLASERELIENILGELDGRLSLKNATVTIDI